MKLPISTTPDNQLGMEKGMGAAPEDAQQLLDHHGQAEGDEQAQDRIGAIEPAKR